MQLIRCCNEAEFVQAWQPKQPRAMNVHLCALCKFMARVVQMYGIHAKLRISCKLMRGEFLQLGRINELLEYARICAITAIQANSRMCCELVRIIFLMLIMQDAAFSVNWRNECKLLE